jgi:hypothetical protein
MGKCCIRFRRLEDLALDVIGEAIRRVPAKAYVAQYESMLRSQRNRAPAKSAGKAARRTGKPARSRRVAKRS